jgi:hypothetical protein
VLVLVMQGWCLGARLGVDGPPGCAHLCCCSIMYASDCAGLSGLGVFSRSCSDKLTHNLHDAVTPWTPSKQL